MRYITCLSLLGYLLIPLIHSDIWGPILESFDGFKYFVTLVDDFTMITWLYLLKSKSELANVFQDFHKLVSTQFSSKICILTSDNGTEYMSHNMSHYLSIHGILLKKSCVGTPQQNGIAERKNRDLLDKNEGSHASYACTKTILVTRSAYSRISYQ